MILTQIKTLSVNDAWKGRRFKTDQYKAYEKELLLLLPNIEIPEGKLQLEIIVGFSSRASDIDNIIKPFLDILQKKYSFNDSRIYRLIIDKTITEKGSEFVAWEISELQEMRKNTKTN